MRKERRNVASGYTLVEVLLVVSILAILLTLGTVVFNSFVRKDQVLVEAKKIEAVVNEAKIKTMAGFSLGRSQALNFGIYFQGNRYILFPGLTYNPQDAGNQEFLLPDSLEITPIFLPANSIVFEKITGKIRGFDPNQNYLILNDKNSAIKKKISINQLGKIKFEDQ